MTKKKKAKRIIFFVIVFLISAGGAYSWSLIEKEHAQAANLNIDDVDFSELADGTYDGYYDGGMYKWRKNRVSVVIEDGKITDIYLIRETEGKPLETINEIYSRVINMQSLQVDTVSQATLTSRAYLKGIEDALN